MSKKVRRQRPRPARPPEQAANPAAAWMHGLAAMGDERWDEAIAAFEHFTRCWPELARRRETQEAIDKLRRVQRGEISAGDYLVERLREQIGHNMDMSDWRLIERKARRMIAAAPERPDGHFALGVACLEQALYPQALEALLAARARDPDYQQTLYNIGFVYVQMGEPEHAIPWLERALAREPKHLPTLHQYAWLIR